MKELSIEQKAQRYDEAIERAKNTIEVNQTIPNIVECVESLFPELKESEDERIRKEMIFYFTEEIPQCSIQEHSDKMRVFISWLKKQEVERTKLELKAGSSYFCYKSLYERADNETFKKGLIYKCNKDGVLDNFVIKNPEQHFIEIKDERIAWLEKHGEQKPTDKVEPKFNEREWIIHQGTDNVYQVVAIVNNQYQLRYGNNYTTQYCEDVDRCARSWDVTKDAKDGDVLVSKVNKPFIYNGNSDVMFIGAHCGIATDDLFVISSKGGCSWTINEHIYPATKEQRDALMKAITDAGYVFDFEKKELKKIKQSSTINQFTIEQASMLDKHVDKFLEQKPAEPNWVHHKVDLSGCSEEYCKAYYDGWNNCNQQHAQLKAEQKPAEWSEDDEKEVAILEAYIRSKDWSERHIERALGIVDELVNKVKSLRPQPKQEWSKEDEDTIKFLINHFCVSHYNRSFQFTSDKVITCDKLIEKIRNLRPHWKPSKEQMETLKYASGGNYVNLGILESLYKDLKKLTK